MGPKAGAKIHDHDADSEESHRGSEQDSGSSQLRRRWPAEIRKEGVAQSDFNSLRRTDRSSPRLMARVATIFGQGTEVAMKSIRVKVLVKLGKYSMFVSSQSFQNLKNRILKRPRNENCSEKFFQT